MHPSGILSSLKFFTKISQCISVCIHSFAPQLNGSCNDHVGIDVQWNKIEYFFIRKRIYSIEKLEKLHVINLKMKLNLMTVNRNEFEILLFIRQHLKTKIIIKLNCIPEILDLKPWAYE